MQKNQYIHAVHSNKGKTSFVAVLCLKYSGFVNLSEDKRSMKYMNTGKVLLEPMKEEFYYGAEMAVFATEGDRKGEIDLIWQPELSATAYKVQVQLNKGKNRKWKDIDIVTRSSCTVGGLKSRCIYRFRVAPIGFKGPGRWSEAVVQKAP